MAAKHMINGQAFTCENAGYMTDTSKGMPHGVGQAHGSVFAVPLASNYGYSLWLEHVTEKHSNRDVFWLMWYDAKGIPTIPLSGILSATDIQMMAGLLANFLKLP